MLAGFQCGDQGGFVAAGPLASACGAAITRPGVAGTSRTSMPRLLIAFTTAVIIAGGFSLVPIFVLAGVIEK